MQQLDTRHCAGLLLWQSPFCQLDHWFRARSKYETAITIQFLFTTPSTAFNKFCVIYQFLYTGSSALTDARQYIGDTREPHGYRRDKPSLVRPASIRHVGLAMCLR